MRSNLKFLGTILFALIFLVGGGISNIANAGTPTTWSVDSNSKVTTCALNTATTCSSIQSAVNVASDGDTINVAAGNYNEIITINTTNLNIKGVVGAKLFVAEGQNGIIVNADNFVLDGLEIQGPSTGDYKLTDWSLGQTSKAISINKSATISNNSISNFRTGIFVSNDAAVIIKGNKIENTKGSILIYGENVTMTNNSTGTMGSEWDIVFLTNIADGKYFTSITNPSQYGIDVMKLSKVNGNMKILDRRYGMGGFLGNTPTVGNRSHIFVKSGEKVNLPGDFNLGNGFGNERQPYGSIQDGVNGVVYSGIVNIAAGEYKLDSQIRIEKAINIVGSGDLTIINKGATDWINVTGSKGLASIITIVSGNNPVVLENLKVTGAKNIAMTDKITDFGHGINIVNSSNVTLNNITSSDNKAAGVTMNASTVIVNNISTANNGWYGMNVDKGSIATPALLTVNGKSSHIEKGAAIYIDDISKPNTATDTNHQYSRSTFTHDAGIVGAIYKLLATGQITPDENGIATVTDTNKEVVVTGKTAITVNLGSIEGATINFDSLIDNTTGSGIIPQTTITSGITTVEISADTTVTAAGWNGVMNAPTTGDSSGTAPVGFSVGSTIVEMGSPDKTLTFDKAVKVTLIGVTGSVGYRPAGLNNWQMITKECTSASVSGISSGECYFHEGGNTIIWTYHFTTFGSLNVVRNSSSGSRPATPAIPATPAVPGVNPAVPATPAIPAGKVLGAEKFNFTLLMKNGSKSNDVMELQKLLTSLGYNVGIADGKFGPKTKGAVIKFQKANKLVGDGIIGAKTRLILNK